MKGRRTKYDAKFKLKVAPVANRERETLNELAAKYGEVSPLIISRRKKDSIENSATGFETPKIINSDQGRRFTCYELKDCYMEHLERKISMDDRSHAKDNIRIERC